MAASIKSKFVVDASFLAAFILPDEKSDNIKKIIDSFLEGNIRIVSSPLLPYEIMNTLASAVLSKRITKAQAFQLSDDFLKLDIPLSNINLQKILVLAIEKKISVYDASYLLLAKEQGVKFLTLDTKL